MESIFQRSACPCNHGNPKPTGIVSFPCGYTLFLPASLQCLQCEYFGESKSHEELFIYPDAGSAGGPCVSVISNALLTSYDNLQYGTLQFGKFDEIQKKGYNAAIDILEKFDDEGRLPAPSIDSKDGLTKGKRKGRSARRNSI